MKEKKETRNFNYLKIFFLGLGFFGVSVIWPLYNSFIPIILEEIFLLSNFLIGIIMTIDNIFAIIMLPYIGTLSDQTRTKFGRRMPYILIGAPVAAVLFFAVPFITKTNNLFFMMGTLITMNFFMALFRSPIVSLMPDVTPSKYRSQANGIINFMGGLGALLAYFIGSFYNAYSSVPYMVAAILLFISNLMVFIFIKENSKYKIKSPNTTDSLTKKTSKEFFNNIKDIFLSKEKSLKFMLFSIFFWFMGFNAVETFFTLFIKKYTQVSEGTGLLILGLLSLSFMIFSIPAGFIGSKLGRKKTISLGITIMLISITLVLFLSFGIKREFLENSNFLIINTEYRDLFIKFLYILFPIAGISWALINVNSLPMIVDMTSKERSGGYTGLYYFFSMAANIFAPPIAGFFIDFTSYNSLWIFSIIFFIIAFITLQKVNRGDIK